MSTTLASTTSLKDVKTVGGLSGSSLSRNKSSTMANPLPSSASPPLSDRRASHSNHAQQIERMQVKHLAEQLKIMEKKFQKSEEKVKALETLNKKLEEELKKVKDIAERDAEIVSEQDVLLNKMKLSMQSLIGASSSLNREDAGGLGGSTNADSGGSVRSTLFESKLVLRLNKDVRKLTAENEALEKEIKALRDVVRESRMNTSQRASGESSGAWDRAKPHASVLLSGLRSMSSGNLPEEGSSLEGSGSEDGDSTSRSASRLSRCKSTGNVEASVIGGNDGLKPIVRRFVGLNEDVFEALQRRTSRRISAVDRWQLFFEKESTMNVIFDRQQDGEGSDLHNKEDQALMGLSGHPLLGGPVGAAFASNILSNASSPRTSLGDYGSAAGDVLDVVIEAITLEKLIARIALFPHPSNRLLDTPAEPSTLDSFLISYRRYCTPMELLDLVRLRWRHEPPTSQRGMMPTQENARQALLQFVLIWVERYMDDFSDATTELLNSAKEFLREDVFALDSGIGRRLLGRLWTIGRPLQAGERLHPIRPSVIASKNAGGGGAGEGSGGGEGAAAGGFMSRNSPLRVSRSDSSSSLNGADSEEGSFGRGKKKISKKEKKLAKKLQKKERKRASMAPIKGSDSRSRLPSIRGGDSQGNSGSEDNGGGLQGSNGSDGKSGSTRSVSVTRSFTAARVLLESSAVSLPLSALPTTEVARQIALVDQQLFQKITWVELLRWSGAPADAICKSRTIGGDGVVPPVSAPSKETHSPNVSAFVAQFNHWHRVAASDMLTYFDPKRRASSITFWVNVAYECLQLNDLSAVMALTSALMSTPIMRLKQSWRALSNSITSKMRSLKELVSSDGSFKMLRARAELADGPYVPHVGLALSDLTFVEDGNPDYVVFNNRPTDLINFIKLRHIAKVLMSIEYAQQGQYDFPELDPLQNLLQQSLVLSEEAMYERSITFEPKSSDRGTRGFITPR